MAATPDVTETPDAPAASRFIGLETIRNRMDLIANYPLHVNGAYRDRPAPAVPESLSPDSA